MQTGSDEFRISHVPDVSYHMMLRIFRPWCQNSYRKATTIQCQINVPVRLVKNFCDWGVVLHWYEVRNYRKFQEVRLFG